MRTSPSVLASNSAVPNACSGPACQISSCSKSRSWGAKVSSKRILRNSISLMLRNIGIPGAGKRNCHYSADTFAGSVRHCEQSPPHMTQEDLNQIRAIMREEIASSNETLSAALRTEFAVCLESLRTECHDHLTAVLVASVRNSQNGWEPRPSPSTPIFQNSAKNRSEERRVGKECRSRWSPYH